MTEAHHDKRVRGKNLTVLEENNHLLFTLVKDWVRRNHDMDLYGRMTVAEQKMNGPCSALVTENTYVTLMRDHEVENLHEKLSYVPGHSFQNMSLFNRQTPALFGQLTFADITVMLKAMKVDKDVHVREFCFTLSMSSFESLFKENALAFHFFVSHDNEYELNYKKCFVHILNNEGFVHLKQKIIRSRRTFYNYLAEDFYMKSAVSLCQVSEHTAFVYRCLSSHENTQHIIHILITADFGLGNKHGDDTIIGALCLYADPSTSSGLVCLHGVDKVQTNKMQHELGIFMMTIAYKLINSVFESNTLLIQPCREKATSLYVNELLFTPIHHKYFPESMNYFYTKHNVLLSSSIQLDKLIVPLSVRHTLSNVNLIDIVVTAFRTFFR